MRRAYSYKRFSSPKQSRGDSIRRQTEFEQRVVKEMGLVLDDSLDLSDTGVSAFQGKNAKFGALAEFIKLVEAGRVPAGSVLIVENLDRLSRENVFDAFNLFSRIISAGVTIVTADDVYDKESVQGNVAKLMVPIVYMMRAHDESKTKSYRVRRAWGERRRRAEEDGRPLTDQCPFWLRVRGDGYEVREDRAETVRLIFRLVREGMGVGQVVAHLVAEGVPAFGRKAGWNRSYVRKLLRWPAVCGVMQPHALKDGRRRPCGDPVPGYYPAVVGREEFDLVRATMTNRRGKDGRPAAGDINLLTGLCWHLGDRARMSVRTSKSGGARRAYIRSAACERGASARDGRSFAYQPLEDAVLTAVCELRAEDVGPAEAAGAAGDAVKTLSGRLLTLDETVKALEAEMTNPDRTAPLDGLMRMHREASEKKKAVADELARAQAETTNRRAETLGEVRPLVVQCREAPPGPERDRLRRKIKTRLRWLVEEIWVHIEKHTHSRSFAHVQVFLRGGTRKYFVVRSADGTPRAAYRDVDFRTYTPTKADLEVGRGRGRGRPST